LVTFDYLNLTDDSYPSPINGTNAVDVIFCRNVIIYLDPPKTRQLVRRFQRCLADYGWLFVGATETSHTLFAEFRPVNLPGVIAYRASGPDFRPVDPRPAQQNAPPSSLPRTAKAGLESAAATSIVSAESAFPMAIGVSIPESRGREADTVVRNDAETHIAPAPLNCDSIVQLAKAHADRGELGEALEWCDRALLADKLDSRLHYLRGTILQELGQLTDASAAFKKALYLAPQLVMAHFALGYLANRAGTRALAERHFGHALQLLRDYDEDESVPESEGITPGRLAQIIESLNDLEMAT
jgi:chemotaxis protein methyltransferase CheR